MQKLICISLTTNHVKHLFIKPVALVNIWCVISLANCLLRSLIHFKVRLLYFSLLLVSCHSLFQLCSLYLIIMPLKIEEIWSQSGKRMLSLSKSRKTKIMWSLKLDAAYTFLFITDKEKVQKLKQSLPPGLAVKELK